MTTSFWKRCTRALAIAATCVLAACGGGGGDGGGGGTAPPPPANLQVSYGIKTIVFDWQASSGATHYRLLEELGGAGTVQVGGDLPAGTTHYEHYVATWSRPFSLYVIQACNAAGCASAKAGINGAALNAAIGYFKSKASANGDQFGSAAALSADGTTLAVGAKGEASAATGIDGNAEDETAPGAGAVFVYARHDGAWVLEAYVKASNAEAGDAFGTSVSLSADGRTLAVGAPGEASAAIGVNGDQADNSMNAAGAVYLFTRDAKGVWSQSAYVKATNTRASALFGHAVAVSGDGLTLLIGANGESGNATGVNDVPQDFTRTGSGAAYVYRRGVAGWVAQAYLKGNQSDLGDHFGDHVALSHDGNRAVVSAPDEDSDTTGVGAGVNNGALSSGAVFLFIRTGSTWTTEAFIKASNTGADDRFGYGLALSADGTTLAVGARGENGVSLGINSDQTNSGANSVGAAYVFDLQAGIWGQRAYIKAPNARHALLQFGGALALSADGRTLVIGAQGEGNSGLGFDANSTGDDESVAFSGAAYVYDRPGTTWQFRHYLKASNSKSSINFGAALALSADAGTLAVCAPFERSNARGIGGNQNDTSLAAAGAVYLY